MTAPAAPSPADRPAPPLARKPLVEVSAKPSAISLASLAELWRFRQVLSGFLVRDVKVKYKQAAIGVGWALLQPVAAAALFAVFLGRLSGVPSEGAPYLLFALAGMAGWTYFSGATSTAADSLVSNQSLLRKVYFPREVLPLASIGAGLVDLVPALVTLATAALLYGVAPTVAWLAFPLPVAVLVAFAVSVSLALAAVNVYYRDVRHALPFILQLGLFASPVVYPLSVVPESWRNLYAILNPAAAAIDGLRRIFVHGTWPRIGLTLSALAWSLVLAAVSYAVFKRLERGFSDRV